MRVLNLAQFEGISTKYDGGWVSVSVTGLGRLRSVLVGYASLQYLSGREFRVELSMLEVSEEPPVLEGSAFFNLPPAPASGLAVDNMGVLMASGAQLDVAYGSDIWVLYFAKWEGDYAVEVGRAQLSVSDGERSAYLSISRTVGRLEGHLSLYAPDDSEARLELVREHDVFLSRARVKEVVARAKPNQSVAFTWRPVRGPEPLLVITKGVPSRSDVLQILEALGAPPGGFFNMTDDYVVGDGDRLRYRLRLTIARRFRRDLHAEEELRLKMTPPRRLGDLPGDA
ncbi:hypothetical protein [Pyrobaculum sp.]|uniref:hypothetical protein n=2 Tax=Pyrobaculum sp. TaxID=2004705 RepID=UPI003166C751